MAECRYPQTEVAIDRVTASAKAAVKRVVESTPTPIDDMAANWIISQISSAIVDVTLATGIGAAADALDRVAD